MRWVSPLLKGRLSSAMRSENAQPLSSFQNSHCGVTLLTSFLCFYWETCRGKCPPRCPECRKKMDIRAYTSYPKEREEYRQHHHTLFVLLALGSQNPGPMDIEISEELLPSGKPFQPQASALGMWKFAVKRTVSLGPCFLG